jgi:hypothetical protein
MSIVGAVVGTALGVGLIALGYNLERAFGSAGLIAGFVIIAIVTIALSDSSSDCHTDWDGRSNPTVCE